MVLIEWNDKFNIGVASADYEHKELIALINEAHRRLVQHDSRSTVLGFLGEIFAKISAHFALEEKIMRDQRYDEYEDHKADHERLLDEIRDIMDDYEDEQEYDEDDVAQRLNDWFSIHFRTKDARLHKHLGI